MSAANRWPFCLGLNVFIQQELNHHGETKLVTNPNITEARTLTLFTGGRGFDHIASSRFYVANNCTFWYINWSRNLSSNHESQSEIDFWNTNAWNWSKILNIQQISFPGNTSPISYISRNRRRVWRWILGHLKMFQWRHNGRYGVPIHQPTYTIVYSTVYSGADQENTKPPGPLAFVWGIHRWPVNSPYKWPVT